MENQEPGPLSPDALSQNRTQSLALFAGDQRTRTSADLTGGIARAFNGGRRLDASLRLRAYDQGRTRTLLLAPSFGDTQRQDDQSLSAWGRAQYSLPTVLGTLRAGVEGEVAGYENRYRAPDGGSVLTEGKGSRLKLATHAEITRELARRVKLHAGLRYDRVQPDQSGAATSTSSFDQWSPRVALNLAYSTDPSAAGNLFVTWTRAFKAPTLDQLFDVRAIPTGVPGQTVSFANPDLKPQRSSAVEAGIYQRVPLGERGRFAELSATVYRQWLDDEIDFDLRTFRYGNIQRSRHTGLEASVRIALSDDLTVVHATSLTRATFRSSELEGNQLKNIPETAFVTSVYRTLPGSLRVTVTHRATGSVFLDDENTSQLSGSDLVDVGLTWSRGPLEATASVRNLFDSRFDSFGYLLYDPFQQVDVRMTHPGAGRGLTLKLTLREGGP
jgi:outer membrane cobalamin receptor